MVRRLLLALAVGIALADASIVTLALPPILVELDATVEQAAAVLGVYTLVLAVALLPAEALRRRAGSAHLGAASLLVVAAASLACGITDSLDVLFAGRAGQAVGAAGALVSTFALLGAGEHGSPGRRAWTAAAVFGAALGPALGGALTQALDWRAIFLVQAPVMALAAAACVRAHEPRVVAPPGEPLRAGPLVALALVSAALTGVLFLLVLLLVTGWSLSPLGAAAVVSVVPAAALAGAAIPGDPRARAAGGAALVGAGVLALAFLPNADAWWTVAPQALAGLGMGLALPALAGPLLPERTPGQAAGVLTARHVGMTVVLALLAPVAATRLDTTVERVREQGAALVLDAKLPPLDKVSLAGTLVGDLDPVDPRDDLRRALDRQAGNFSDDPEEAAAFDDLRRRADETLVRGVNDAFAPTFLIAGALAVLALLAVPSVPVRRHRLALAAGVAAFLLPAGLAYAKPRVEPEPVAIRDPCQARDLPSTGGLDGIVQDAALIALDRAACRFGSSREELALALADADLAQDYEREHGVDPRDAGKLIGGVLGL